MRAWYFRVLSHLTLLPSLSAGALVVLLSACSDSPNGPGRDAAPDVMSSWGSLWGLSMTGASNVTLTPDESAIILTQRESSSALCRVERATGAVKFVWIGGHPGRTVGIPGSQDLVALLNSSREVVVIDPTGTAVRRWTIPGDPLDAGYLDDMTFNTSRSELVILDASGDRVHRYTVEGQHLGSTVVGELAGSSWSSPNRIVSLQSGDLIAGEGRFWRLNPGGRVIGPWPSDGKEFSESELAVGGDGNVYLLDRTGTELYRYSERGVLLGSERYDGRNRFATNVGGLAVTRDGVLILAEGGFPVVTEVSLHSDQSRSHLFGVLPIDAVGAPADIAVANDGRIYVADPGLRRVVRVTPDRFDHWWWGSPGSTTQPLLTPIDIVPTPDGRILVGDSGRDELRTYTPEGVLLHRESRPPGSRYASGKEFIYEYGEGLVYRRDLVAGSGTSWMRLPGYLDGHSSLVECGPGDALYSLSRHTPEVRILDGLARSARVISLTSSDAGRVPLAFAVDDLGWMYTVTRRHSEKDIVVSVYDADGRLRVQWREGVSLGGRESMCIEVADDRSILVGRSGGFYRRYAAVH